MALRHVQKTYEKLGESDPLYAVLSFREARGNRWDPEAFFQRGREEIELALEHLEAIGLKPNPGRAMDVGCGAGGLTQALCEHFDSVVGIDISQSMIDTAKHYNRHGERCDYRVNTTDDLAQLEDAQFDFVYSNIALQHSPPQATMRYIREFFRILKPGGIALFQVPSGPRHEPGSIGAHLYNLKRGPLRRFWKGCVAKPRWKFITSITGWSRRSSRRRQAGWSRSARRAPSGEPERAIFTALCVSLALILSARAYNSCRCRSGAHPRSP